MHYGVIGIGPVGATFAALLSASGQRVSALDANQELVTSFRGRSLKIKGFYKTEAPVKDVFSSFDEFVAGDPDVVIISVKTNALPGLLARIKNSPLRDKAIISCQNGIDTEKEIAEVLGEEHAFRMVLNFGVSYCPEDHEVTVNFLNEPHFFSCESQDQVAFSRQVVAEFAAAGMGVSFVDDITPWVFKKAILNTTLSCVCALTRMTMSEAMSESDLQSMVRAIISEGIAICKANDIAVEAEFLEEAVGYLSKGGNHKPSMLLDIEYGRSTEIRHLAGKLYEYAQRQGVDVPVIQSMFYLIKALEKSVTKRERVPSQAS